MKETPNVFRLRKRHGAGVRRAATAADGERLVQAQSLSGALLAGLVAVAMLCV
ncbi:MAG: hypothetical protein KJP16_10810 [Gammaproteobacteria bacterium]|nr:hypothetical protein [Gammaproteobacteria bacterium]NNL51299.1 hypothetical protein [Woeseiaceae bacterium]